MTFARNILTAAVLALALATTTEAQPRPSESVLNDPLVDYQARRGLTHLYNFDFERADRLFSQIDARYPEHPIGPFLNALNVWWQILLDLADDSRDEIFYERMETVIDRSDRMLRRDRKNFDAMFFKGAALGFRGRLRSNRGDWYRAGRDGIRAMEYVFAVADSDPDNPDYMFGRGLYDYYASVVPQRYPYTRPIMIFFPRGDRQRGLDRLESTARHGRFIQTEAAYFLLQIYYVFENDREKSFYYANWLRDNHPDNSFFHTFAGRVNARWAHWRAAEQIFTDVLERYRTGKTGYNEAAAEQALYYLGRIAMIHGDFDTAETRLQELHRIAARSPEDTYFKVLGRLRHAMTLDAQGQRSDAVRLYRDVLAMKDWAGAHERARSYLETPYSFGKASSY
ncbi:MAG: tetratricopeptide repeat protein [Bacteroidota bacterium]